MRLILALSVWVSTFFYFSQDRALDQLINQWHQDAASAAFSDYFSATSQGFVFLGTAPEERWNKLDFKEFCKPYFDKGVAWNFKPSNRKWIYSEDGNTAWFDEDLETWMEGCRGTGICIKEGARWKIAYYNLHVLIENEKIQEFITLRKKQ
tara:strand:- start:8156 stop:8608 length:453 start_codon:yes stop_codon:yes gene_type:complete